MSPALRGAVALVTGATRGVGKGIADVLVEGGARVYVTGRSCGADTFADGRWPIRCDHMNDADTTSVFARVFDREQRLDILVNSAWSGYERMIDGGQFTWPLPFWQQPVWRWDAMFDGGVRAAFVCSQFAARRMVEQRSGLIVNVSFWAAQKYIGNALYGAAKCATDRLTRDMALELAPHHVTVVSLYPGLVRTEKVMESAALFDMSNSESPQFCGRAVAHLYADPQRQDRSGDIVVAAQLAVDDGFTDIDGRQPRPLTLADV